MGAKKETKPVKVEKVVTNEVSIPKTMTLDEIEAEMMKCLLSKIETIKLILIVCLCLKILAFLKIIDFSLFYY